MSKKLLTFFLLSASASFVFAEGPRYRNKEPNIQLEFENVYQDLRNVNAVSSTTLPSGSTFYIQNGSTPQTATFNVSSGTATELITTTATIQNINGTFIGMGRNRIINGDMKINQRYENAIGVVSGNVTAYTLDRWAGNIANSAGEGTFNVTRLSSSTAPGTTNYLEVKIMNADQVVSATQIYRIYQRIEGANVRDFLFGTSSAKTIALSFWVKSSTTGTFGGALSNANANGSYPFNYSIPTANVWTYISTGITGATIGSWNGGTGIGLEVSFGLGVGSTFAGPAGTWSSSDYRGASGSQNLIHTANATWDLTSVQIEIGGQATSFEFAPDPIGIMQCQRYYEKSYVIGVSSPGFITSINTSEVAATLIGASTARSGGINFKVEKRGAPSITLYNYVTGNSGSWSWTSAAGITASRTTIAGAPGTKEFVVQQSASTDLYGEGHWIADSEL